MGVNSSAPNQTSQNPLLPADGPKTNGICYGTLQHSTKLTSDEKDESSDKEASKSSELPTGSDLYPNETVGNTKSSEVYVNNEKRGKILINLHNGESFSLEEADFSKTVERICWEKLLKEFPNIGPAAIQLFGLGCFDSKRVPKILWKSPHSKFIPSNETQKFYLRIRYIPNPNLLDSLMKLGEDVLRYLYYQFQDDFVKDRLHYIYDDPVKNSAKAHGYAVLSICIKGKFEGKEPSDILDSYGQRGILPKREHKRFWTRIRLMKNMKEKATEITKSYESLTLNDWMILFVRDILQEIKSYGVEMYEARRPVRNEKVHVLVNVHGPMSGVFLSQEHFSTIEDLRSISIAENFQSRMGRNVHLDRCSGCPEVLRFENQETAESFVSGLNGFSRLIRDYYFSLCREMEPPSAKQLIISRCHGPIESDAALTKLRRKDLSPEFYILKQDIYKFDSYAILFNNNGQLRKRLIHKKGNKFYYEDEQEQSFSNIKELITYLADVRSLLPKNPIPVRPRQEPVDILRNLFVENKILDEDEEELLLARNKKKQHMVLLPEDMKRLELIDMGSFTQVHKGELQDGKQVAVKSLRETNLAQTYHSYEPFNNAIQQMIRLDNPAFLVAIHGVCLTSPPLLVMEKASYGSLSKFFVDRTNQQPIYLHHLMNTALHVAHGLLYMSENDIYHGNICCRNILVHKYAIEKMEVKIGDPGMITLLNQLPVNHPENVKRLPWIAPELLGDLQKMNTQTDMYAFGTTVWEMFCFGLNPMDLSEFAYLNTKSARDVEKIKEQLNQKLPVPSALVNKREDDEGVKKCKIEIQRLMSLCWTNAQDRSDASMMVRDILALMSCYGGDYHNYSIIPDEKLDESESGNQLTPRYKRNTSEVPQIPLAHSGLEFAAKSTPKVKLPEKVTEMKPAFTAVRPSPPTTPPKTETVDPIRETRKETEAVYTRKEKTWTTRPLPDKPELDLTFLISSRRLEISRTPLGSGYYGEVKKGKLYKSETDHSDPVDIAAKELKGEYQNVIDSPEFKREAILMSQLSHSNVVKFIGISDNRLILEFVENGSLSTYLRKLRKDNGSYLEKSTMMKMILDVAMGMEYLASVNVIHCDLAGRNVLLTKDLMAKITDFGLAKILQEDKDYYRRSKSKGLPACWCAPEGLRERKFTTKGDVWSFGVLMWEVFTHAKAPLLCEEFSKYGLQKLEEGKRLQKPSHCPDEMYVLMKDCWQYRPQDRPDFPTISERCRQYLLTLPGQAVQETPETDKQSEPTTNNSRKIQTSDLVAALATVKQRKQSGRPLPPHQDITKLGLQKNLDIDQSPDGVLGKGQFGVVRKGVLQQDDGTKIDVAVKIFRDHDNSKDDITLEIDILGSVEHRNVVKLYKYMNVPVVCIVMEYMKTGCLKKQLDKHKEKGTSMEPGLLLRICTDVAAGLDYLSGKNILHCDLAARNILLTEDFQAKISDFGLSKLIIEEKDYYRRLKEWNMPFRWCAPEVFEQHILSSKGDVWSFAVLMWECFSGGKVPSIVVNENKNIECSQMLEQLRNGKRLPKPEACHEEIYSLMEKCWKFNREERPNFNQIYTRCLQLQEELGMVLK